MVQSSPEIIASATALYSNSLRRIRDALDSNPVVIEPNLSKLMRRISTDEEGFIVYESFYTTFVELRKYCNLLRLRIPAVDDSFPFAYFIKRRDIPSEISNRLDLALISLRTLADRVRM